MCNTSILATYFNLYITHISPNSKKVTLSIETGGEAKTNLKTLTYTQRAIMTITHARLGPGQFLHPFT